MNTPIRILGIAGNLRRETALLITHDDARFHRGSDGGLGHCRRRLRAGREANSRCLLRGAFTLSKLVLFVIGSPAQFRNRFRSLSNVNRSGSQKASKNAAAAAEKTE